jgi:hypothetical protein
VGVGRWLRKRHSRVTGQMQHRFPMEMNEAHAIWVRTFPRLCGNRMDGGGIITATVDYEIIGYSFVVVRRRPPCRSRGCGFRGRPCFVRRRSSAWLPSWLLHAISRSAHATSLGKPWPGHRRPAPRRIRPGEGHSAPHRITPFAPNAYRCYGHAAGTAAGCRHRRSAPTVHTSARRDHALARSPTNRERASGPPSRQIGTSTRPVGARPQHATAMTGGDRPAASRAPDLGAASGVLWTS